MRCGALLPCGIDIELGHWAVQCGVLLPRGIDDEHGQWAMHCGALLPRGFGHRHGKRGVQPRVGVLLPGGVQHVGRDAVPGGQVLRGTCVDWPVRHGRGLPCRVLLPCGVDDQCRCRAMHSRVLLPCGIVYEHGRRRVRPCDGKLLSGGVWRSFRDAVPVRKLLSLEPGKLSVRLGRDMSSWELLPLGFSGTDSVRGGRPLLDWVGHGGQLHGWKLLPSKHGVTGMGRCERAVPCRVLLPRAHIKLQSQWMLGWRLLPGGVVDEATLCAGNVLSEGVADVGRHLLDLSFGLFLSRGDFLGRPRPEVPRRRLLPCRVKQQNRRRGLHRGVLLPPGIGHRHGQWGLQPGVGVLLPGGVLRGRRDAVPRRKVLPRRPFHLSLRLRS